MKDAKDIAHLTSLLCFNAYALNRAFGRYYQAAFGETGLTYPKFVILTALNEAGPMTVSELSARAAVEPNTLSPLLKKMASFDLITRQRAEEDERRVVLAIADTGRAVLARAHAVVMQGFEDLGLDADAVEQAVQFMQQARGNVDAAKPPRLSLDDLK
ncbi:MarR family transcriptional regulator [uncultured Tateyamaria sp.]|uniref:MarR family winged helix-turn-helix transcriptional regulator n=1 Tax=Tateyamaria sp. 1078 TaxID=3417464 RepID=UPI002636ABB2|nr:MarR family transcriptional regulator [uncultured Tateyamaria sp.]